MDNDDFAQTIRDSAYEFESRVLDYEHSIETQPTRSIPLFGLMQFVRDLARLMRAAEQDEMAALIENLETLIGLYQQRGQVLPRQIIDTFLGVVDVIVAAQSSRSEPREFRMFRARVARFIAELKSPEVPTPSTRIRDASQVLSSPMIEPALTRQGSPSVVDDLCTSQAQLRVGRPRILIVEDEFVSRSLLLAILASYGECDVAVDGREATEALIRALDRGRPYALVMLDIMMPEFDGHYVLSALRNQERAYQVEARARVIITTALTDYETFQQAFQESCDAYLVKPISKAALLRQLRRLGFETATGAKASQR